MARITPAEAQAWGERTKLKLDTLDTALLDHLEAEVLGQIGGTYDTSTWVDTTSTPKLVRTIIAKLYVAWFYDRQYSEDTDSGNPYAANLKANAAMLIEGIVDGSITIPGVDNTAGEIAFYPTDASSMLDPRDFPDDPSVGPAVFSMTTRY